MSIRSVAACAPFLGEDRYRYPPTSQSICTALGAFVSPIFIAPGGQRESPCGLKPSYFSDVAETAP